MIIMLATIVTTVFAEWVMPVAVGVGIAIVLFVSRMSQAQMKPAKRVYVAEHFDDLTLG
ncbi:MAG: MFS superfamily sulfate permease-like transporter [Gammaproteobacteria bacterium]|jgi:MFS superfamily sulfate permease-like transporter